MAGGSKEDQMGRGTKARSMGREGGRPAGAREETAGREALKPEVSSPSLRSAPSVLLSCLSENHMLPPQKGGGGGGGWGNNTRAICWPSVHPIYDIVEQFKLPN